MSAENKIKAEGHFIWAVTYNDGKNLSFKADQIYVERIAEKSTVQIDGIDGIGDGSIILQFEDAPSGGRDVPICHVEVRHTGYPNAAGNEGHLMTLNNRPDKLHCPSFSAKLKVDDKNSVTLTGAFNIDLIAAG